MRYLADILTFSRIGLAMTLLIICFTGAPIHIAFIIYMIGEITDALDGTCATHFPFPKDKIPKYRKYAVKYDMFADGFLAFSMVRVLGLKRCLNLCLTQSAWEIYCR